jgi:hypothetical protein
LVMRAADWALAAGVLIVMTLVFIWR